MKKHLKIDVRPEVRGRLPEGIRHILDNTFMGVIDRRSDTGPLFRRQRPVSGRSVQDR